MQIIIDIPEDMYKDLKDGYICEEYGDELVNLVSKAIVLPKGHGGLIDANELFKKMFICSDGSIVKDNDIDNFPNTLDVHYIKKSIRTAPTVLEADKEARNYERTD